jgi:hypothetical protein
MASKLLGKGLGRMFGSATGKGKNRLTPDLKEDVVGSQRSDLAAMRRALNVDDEPTVRGAARQSVQEAGGRAAIRTGGRVAAGGAALAAGYEGGRMARGEAERTRGRMRSEEDEEDTTPKRVAVASRTMDDEDEAPKAAEKKTTFKEAFAAARKGGDKTFTWEGKRYTTELASEGPKASVREGRNKNIDDETRKKAEEMYKGGAVKKKVKMAMGGSVPTIYAGVKAPKKPSIGKSLKAAAPKLAAPKMKGKK